MTTITCYSGATVIHRYKFKDEERGETFDYGDGEFYIAKDGDFSECEFTWHGTFSVTRK